MKRKSMQSQSFQGLGFATLMAHLQNSMAGSVNRNNPALGENNAK